MFNSSEDKAVLQNGTHWWSKATETSKEFVTKTTESSVRNGHVLKNSMDCDSTQSESASATRTAIKSNHSAKQHSETTRKYSESSLTSKYDFNQFMSSELQSSQSTGRRIHSVYCSFIISQVIQPYKMLLKSLGKNMISYNNNNIKTSFKLNPKL